jgi:hypothetical protein
MQFLRGYVFDEFDDASDLELLDAVDYADVSMSPTVPDGITGQSLHIAPGGHARFALPADQAGNALILPVDFKFVASAGSGCLLSFEKNGTAAEGVRQAALIVAADNTFRFFVGAAQQAAGTFVLNTTKFLRLDIRYLCDPSVGVFQLFVNGNTTPDINFAGNTQGADLEAPGGGSDNSIQALTLGFDGNNDYIEAYVYRVVLANDGGDVNARFPRYIGHRTRHPNRDGASVWPDSTGTNAYTEINEPLGALDASRYVQTDQPGKNLVGIEPLGVSANEILFVQQHSSFALLGSGAATVKTGIKVGDYENQTDPIEPPLNEPVNRIDVWQYKTGSTPLSIADIADLELTIDCVAFETEDKVVLTIPTGAVSADLTGFPVYVNLAGMPAQFWDGVSDDGGDIRVTTDADVVVPTDLVFIDIQSKTGTLFFRADLLAASDNVFFVKYATGLTKLPVDDTYGRNNVWQDYEAVYLFGASPHNRAGGASLRVIGDPDFFENTATSGDVNGHEGLTTDGTHYYVFDSNAIRKYDAAWTLVATNADPAGATGLPVVNGIGDGCVANGKIYVPVGDDPGGTVQYIGVFDADDLTFIQAFDITSNGLSAAGFCYNPSDGLLYTIRYNDGSDIRKFDPIDGAYQGAIPLSVTLLLPQSIELWNGAFWIPVDNVDETYYVELDGTVVSTGMFGAPNAATTTWEGLVAEGGSLLQLNDTGTSEVVRTYRPYSLALSAGGGANIWADARIIGDFGAVGALGTSFSVGVSFAPADDVQRVIASISAAGAVFGDNINIAVDNGNSIGIYDSSNSWLYFSPTKDPALNTMHRVNIVYNSTTARHAYYNGGSKTTDNAITARGSTLGHLVIGSSLEGNYGEPWRGKVGFAYARPGVLSDDWIAAEYANLNNPSSFYTLTTL